MPYEDVISVNSSDVASVFSIYVLIHLFLMAIYILCYVTIQVHKTDWKFLSARIIEY